MFTYIYDFHNTTKAFRGQFRDYTLNTIPICDINYNKKLYNKIKWELMLIIWYLLRLQGSLLENPRETQGLTYFVCFPLQIYRNLSVLGPCMFQTFASLMCKDPVERKNTDSNCNQIYEICVTMLDVNYRGSFNSNLHSYHYPLGSTPFGTGKQIIQDKSTTFWDSSEDCVLFPKWTL